ncbi:hypothetical protein B0T16DRAFT_452541 [Cercophora newfieldiana]|uniref:Uncharacterized protein n=1 Tax=Cercophora newfieldiana TaxID=92897 RepID=A0AA39YQZ4_9PEZI|nr:hypothetical protein B0T16DRAFT_452541 [Cercophora newfieldiana]
MLNQITLALALLATTASALPPSYTTAIVYSTRTYTVSDYPLPTPDSLPAGADPGPASAWPYLCKPTQKTRTYTLNTYFTLNTSTPYSASGGGIAHEPETWVASPTATITQTNAEWFYTARTTATPSAKLDPEDGWSYCKKSEIVTAGSYTASWDGRHSVVSYTFTTGVWYYSPTGRGPVSSTSTGTSTQTAVAKPTPEPEGESGSGSVLHAPSGVGAVVNTFKHDNLESVILLTPSVCQPLKSSLVQWTWKKEFLRGIRIYQGTEKSCDCTGRSDLLILGNIQHQVPKDYWCIMLS